MLHAPLACMGSANLTAPNPTHQAVIASPLLARNAKAARSIGTNCWYNNPTAVACTENVCVAAPAPSLSIGTRIVASEKRRRRKVRLTAGFFDRTL